MSNSSDDSSQSLAKSAIGFVSGTVFSRVTGLLRDMSMAFCFGTTSAIAAFFIAYRFANLLRRIFGEGALLTSFIPHFELYRNENPKRAALFFRDIFFSLTFSLLLIISLGELFLYGQWRAETAADHQFILLLTMIMLPGVLFICLYSICSGLLHCEKQFFLSGIAPMGFNLVWIAAVWVFRNHQNAVVGVSAAITVAFFFQWLITIPKTLSFILSHLSWKEFFKIHLFSPEIKHMLSSMSIGVLGVGATQINSAVDTVFARYASLEGPAYLNYAIHIQQLPLALFGIGIASALLPPLSRAMRAGNLEKYQQLLNFALTAALTLLIPFSLGILCLGGYGINLIYGRGDFNQVSTIQTTYCLWGYGVGLIPMGLALILTPAFYARHNYWIPTLAAVSSILVNALLNFCFVFFLNYGPASLAVSTSAAAYFNVCFLVYFLFKKIDLRFSSLSLSCSKVLLCSAVGTMCVIAMEWLSFNHCSLLLAFYEIKKPFSRELATQLLQFFLLSGCFFSGFFLSAWLLKVREVFQLLQLSPKNWKEVY